MSLKAKEKAKELIERHTKVLFDVGLAINKELVRQSVLLCIQELIEQLNLPKDDWFEERLEYLLEIKEYVETF